jgi:acyl transferase domain-containing protein
MSRRRPHGVAIVGMGCGFPGAADLFTYWADVLADRDSIGRNDSHAGRPDHARIGDVVRAALADAGLGPERLSGDRVEVVVASGRGGHDSIRDVANRMNWKNACFIDDPNASAIAAVDVASGALLERRADLAAAVCVTVEEGVGVVVLKRLRDAERDGDRVYAIVNIMGLI